MIKYCFPNILLFTTFIGIPLKTDRTENSNAIKLICVGYLLATI